MTDAAVQVGTGRVRLQFRPDGGDVRVPAGTTVFDAASWNGIAIDSTCGGHGTCKKCKVRVISGAVPIDSVDPRAFTIDELKGGWRLACRAAATEDLEIDVPPLQTRPKAALVGVGRHVILRPAVQKRYLELEEPSLDDQVSDLERVLAAVDDYELRVHPGAVRMLGRTLRASDFKVTAVICDDLLIDVEPGDTTADRHAIAFDLGTTTVVANLLDLATGQPLAVRSMLNRQQPFGADVISRVSATMLDPDALEALQARAAETLNQLASEVCAEAGVERERVYEMVVCGNVTMTQIALGIDPEPLAVAPFIVAARRLPAVTSADYGVPLHPRAPAYTSPRSAHTWAATSSRGCSRPASPATAGCGSSSTSARTPRSRWDRRSAWSRPPRRPARPSRRPRSGAACAPPRARSRACSIAGDELTLEVIGDTDPVGMCGSGLVDAVAQLVACGLLDHSGRFVPDEDAQEAHPVLSERLVKVGEERVFVLAWRGDEPENAIYLSQRDVRELQFAKASIATGWMILMSELGITATDVAQVLLAGSFGSYLSPASAVRIGLVPKLPLTRIVSAGNVAGEGSKMAALSLRERAAADAILDEVEYVELSGRADFNDMFIDQLKFPG